jgi:hypothetical protein
LAALRAVAEPNVKPEVFASCPKPVKLLDDADEADGAKPEDFSEVVSCARAFEGLEAVFAGFAVSTFPKDGLKPVWAILESLSWLSFSFFVALSSYSASVSSSESKSSALRFAFSLATVASACFAKDAMKLVLPFTPNFGISKGFFGGDFEGVVDGINGLKPVESAEDGVGAACEALPKAAKSFEEGAFS